MNDAGGIDVSDVSMCEKRLDFGKDDLETGSKNSLVNYQVPYKKDRPRY